jgi:hypothetical protein
MKRTTKLFAALALCALTSLSFAAASNKNSADTERGAGMGIITPDVSTSVVVFDYFIHFRDTGEFGVCANGRDESRCVVNKYLTPEQYVAKFYPKSRYVGYRLFMSSANGSDTYLYLYLQKLPQ